MSLINDALKRATEAQTPNPVAAAPESRMTPTERHGSVGIPGYFMPVLLCIFSGACFFVIYGWKNRPAGSTDAIPVQAREVAASAPDVSALAATEEAQRLPAPEHRQFSLQDAPPADRIPVEPAQGESPAPSAQATAATAEAPDGVSFRLQGIFYRPKSPCAVVNSHTVYVGDVIGGGKVTGIDRSTVTLQVDGQTKVLTLR